MVELGYFMQRQAAALKERADLIGKERERLQQEARALQARADAAWVRFGDADNQWQALMSASQDLQNPHDFHAEIRKKAAHSASLAPATVVEDDGEAA